MSNLDECLAQAEEDDLPAWELHNEWELLLTPRGLAVLLAQGGDSVCLVRFPDKTDMEFVGPAVEVRRQAEGVLAARPFKTAWERLDEPLEAEASVSTPVHQTAPEGTPEPAKMSGPSLRTVRFDPNG